MEKDCKGLFWTKVLKVLSASFVIFSIFSCVMSFYFPALVASVIAFCMACGSGNPLPIAITFAIASFVIGVPVYIIATEIEKITFSRPMTHDLLKNILEQMGHNVFMIVLN